MTNAPAPIDPALNTEPSAHRGGADASAAGRRHLRRRTRPRRGPRAAHRLRRRGFLSELTIAASLVLAAAATPAEEITFLTWNLESGDSETATIARQLVSLGGFDVVGLTEVDDDAISAYEAALDSTAAYDVVYTDEGGNDRIVLAYRPSELALLESYEMIEVSLVSYRPALWARFEHRATGTRFLVVLVHLARGSEGEEFSRWAQSRALRVWANWRRGSPIVMLGDFNYDYHVDTGAHDRGYDVLTEDDLQWIRPPQLVPTIDNYPSVLDFIFVNEAADPRSWSSLILVRPDDFPDTPLTSDHRPVAGVWAVAE